MSKNSNAVRIFTRQPEQPDETTFWLNGNTLYTFDRNRQWKVIAIIPARYEYEVDPQTGLILNLIPEAV